MTWNFINCFNDNILNKLKDITFLIISVKLIKSKNMNDIIKNKIQYYDAILHDASKQNSIITHQSFWKLKYDLIYNVIESVMKQYNFIVVYLADKLQERNI